MNAASPMHLHEGGIVSNRSLHLRLNCHVKHELHSLQIQYVGAAGTSEAEVTISNLLSTHGTQHSITVP